MRVKLFHDESGSAEESIKRVQDSANGWLRKLRRRKEYRVVDQEVRFTTDGDYNGFLIAVWYEKKGKEVHKTFRGPALP